MSRNPKAPFNREFTVTQTGILGNIEGDYVGDIKTIYIHTSSVAAEGLIEGKIGRGGKWYSVPFSIVEGLTGAIDISGYEYIRFTATRITQSTDIRILGLFDQVNDELVQIEYKEREQDRSIDSACLLKEIKSELIKLNTYMALITGEDKV